MRLLCAQELLSRHDAPKVANRLVVFEDDGHLTQVEGNWTTWDATRSMAGNH